MTRHSIPQLSTQNSALSTISWAAYLACSWTWCIGMFLPVLMMRNFGIAGWLVFAIPNIVGAAAMGWVLQRPGASQRIVEEHHSACVGFSAVTLAFHVFFLAWLANRVIPLPLCIGAAVLGSALAGIARQRRGLDLFLAWVALLVSLVVLARGLTHFTIADPRGFDNCLDLFWLGPVIAFGFVFCPYLDLTFHRAKQATSAGAGKFAFGFGFGLLFLAMIFLTMLYEGDLSETGKAGSFGPAGLRTWVALHMAVQIGFTWAAHLRALPKAAKFDTSIWILAGIFAITAAALVWQPSVHWFLSGESIYRMFMGFYGLVFPAYVWLCMVGQAGPSRRTLAVWAGVVVAVIPIFWMGFILGHMWWLGPGLGIVISSKLLCRQPSQPLYY